MNQPTLRKPIGVLMILALILVWAVLAVTVAGWIAGAPKVVHLIYYVVTGIAWIFPMRPLLVWMETGRWRVPKGS